MSNRDRSLPAFSIIYNIVAVPYNFLIGFIVGLAAPLAAIAAMVAGVRLLTGRVPFPFLAEKEEEQGRYVSLSLVEMEEAKELFDEQKEKIGGDITRMQAEIKAIIEEAQAEAVEQVEEAAD